MGSVDQKWDILAALVSLANLKINVKVMSTAKYTYHLLASEWLRTHCVLKIAQYFVSGLPDSSVSSF